MICSSDSEQNALETSVAALNQFTVGRTLFAFRGK